MATGWDAEKYESDVGRDLNVHSRSFVALSKNIETNSCPIANVEVWNEFIDVGTKLFEETGQHGPRPFVRVVEYVEENLMAGHRGKLAEITELLDDPALWKNPEFLKANVGSRLLALMAFCSRSARAASGYTRNPTPKSEKLSVIIRAALAQLEEPPPLHPKVPPTVAQFNSRPMPQLPEQTIYKRAEPCSNVAPTAQTTSTTTTSSSSFTEPHLSQYTVDEVRVDSVELDTDPEALNIWNCRPLRTIWWRTKCFREWAEASINLQACWITVGDELYCDYNVMGFISELETRTASKVSIVHLYFSDLCQHEGTSTELMNLIAENNGAWLTAAHSVLYVSRLQAAPLFPNASIGFTKLHEIMISSKVIIITSSSSPIDIPPISNVIQFRNIVNPLITPPVAEIILPLIFRLGLFGTTYEENLWKELASFFFGPASMMMAYIDMVKSNQHKQYGAIKMAASKLQAGILSRYAREAGASSCLEDLQGALHPGEIQSETPDCMRFTATTMAEAQHFHTLSHDLNMNSFSIVERISTLEFRFVPPFTFGSLPVLADPDAAPYHAMASFPWMHLLRRYLDSPFKSYCLQELITPGSRLRNLFHVWASKLNLSWSFSDTPNFRVGLMCNVAVETACSYGASLVLVEDKKPFTVITPVRITRKNNSEVSDSYYFIQMTDCKTAQGLNIEAYDFVNNMCPQIKQSACRIFLSAEDIPFTATDNSFALYGNQIPGFVVPAHLPSREQQRAQATAAREAKMKGKKALASPLDHKD